MNIYTIVLTVLGLGLFEIISSIDNAIINAEVLGTMGAKSRRWFSVWGLLIAVVLVRGLLPWLIVWLATPGIGPIQALTAAFSGNASVMGAVEKSAPILLAGGGTFLLFLFIHWLFLESKEVGLIHEKFFLKQGIWFYAVASIFLAGVVKLSLAVDPLMAFGAVLGSTAFFITNGFKQNAESQEKRLLGKSSGLSDMSKILFLEIIDATFSIDGVLGAFAFTLSVPLILLGNGIGALVVRQFTVGNVDSIRKLKFLKNGAMYSVLILGMVMLADAFGAAIPEWFSPLATFAVVGYFFLRSTKTLAK